MLLPVRIEMLGGLVVFVDDRRIDRFQTQKTGLLLAYLALQMPRTVNREAVAEMLWPDADFVAKRNRLNQAVSSLRRQLHTPDEPNPSVIVAEGQMIGLNVNGVRTDVSEFEKLIETAGRTKNSQEKYRAIRQAIELYKGDLLDGYYPDWGITDRLRLSDRYSWGLNELVKHHSRTGEPEIAAEFVQRRLAAEPRDMEAHAQLMELYLRSGRPATAVRHYEEISGASSASEPISPQIERLYERALKENARTAAPLPRASSSVKAGELPHDRAKTVVPRPWDAFFGREKELTVLAEALERGERLITILGIGGGGKTRLALEAAWRGAEIYDNRVYVVGLSHIKEMEGVPSECVKRILGVDVRPGHSSLESLVAALVTKGPSLLVLDNVEQLIPAFSGFVAALLDQAPELQIICTSRQPLDLPFESQLLLQPLPTPSTSKNLSLSEIAKSPAVGLFLARAQAVRSDFQLTERVSAAIADLCRALEGLPLAIELAAGWSRTLSPSQILERVNSRTQTLESRRKDISPRHRSMTAAIEGSYELLTENERETFLRLSRFSGGWTQAAASCLCPGLDVMEEMDGLMAKAMIRISDHDRETARFSMLEAIKSFALQQIPAGLAEETARRHANYFVEYVLGAVHGGNFFEEIDREYFNVIAALDFLVESGEVETAAMLNGVMAEFWEVRGLPLEGLNWIDACLPMPLSPRNVSEARLSASSGRLLWLKGDYEEAASRLSVSLPLLEAEGERRDLMQARLVLAREAHRKGDFDTALQWLSGNLASSDASTVSLEARSRLGMGNAYVELGQWEEAQKEYERALDLFSKTGDKYWTGSIMVNLGNLAFLENHLESAREWSDRAFELHSQAGHGWHTSMDLVLRAKVDSATGDFRSALGGLERAYRMTPEVLAVQWRVLQEVAWVFSRLGRQDAAVKVYGFVEKLLEENSPGRHPIETKKAEERLQELRNSIPRERFESYWKVGRSLDRAEIGRLFGAI